MRCDQARRALQSPCPRGAYGVGAPHTGLACLQGVHPSGQPDGGLLGRTPPVLSTWLAHKFTIRPSKYLQPLWQLIGFDPVPCCERVLLTHAFLKPASSLTHL